jgi:hypothetical protein
MNACEVANLLSCVSAPSNLWCICFLCPFILGDSLVPRCPLNEYEVLQFHARSVQRLRRDCEAMWTSLI